MVSWAGPRRLVLWGGIARILGRERGKRAVSKNRCGDIQAAVNVVGDLLHVRDDGLGSVRHGHSVASSHLRRRTCRTMCERDRGIEKNW